MPRALSAYMLRVMMETSLKSIVTLRLLHSGVALAPSERLPEADFEASHKERMQVARDWTALLFTMVVNIAHNTYARRRLKHLLWVEQVARVIGG